MNPCTEADGKNKMPLERAKNTKISLNHTEKPMNDAGDRPVEEKAFLQSRLAQLLFPEKHKEPNRHRQVHQ